MVTYHIDDTIGYITLKSNSNATLATPRFALLAELQDFFANPQIKGVIICGEGKNFSRGADPQSIDTLTRSGTMLSHLHKGKELLECIRNAPIPTVAVVRGACLGAGFEIALAAQFIFSAQSAMFGFPESELSLMPGLGGTLSLSPQKRSLLIDLILSGKMISAEEAHMAGIIRECKPAKDILDAAILFINTLTHKRSREQITYIMQSIANSFHSDRKAALHQESVYFVALAEKLAHKTRDNS